MFENFGQTILRPRGSLAVAAPRELSATRKIWGAFERDGLLAGDTVRSWGDRSMPPHPIPDRMPELEVVSVYEEDVVWGGGIWPDYGHFLTECVSRLWPLLPGEDLEGLPAVFVRPLGLKRAPEWLDAFGIRPVELPEQGIARFSRMLVPEPAWRLDTWIAPEIRDIHLHARRGMDIPASEPIDVLWLSRAKLGKQGRVAYDESLLEWILGEHLTIISPEAMTLPEQIAAIESSRAVAGVMGSAFHTMLMAEHLPDCLYLCSGRFHSAHSAQTVLLNVDAQFARALAVTEMRPHSFRGAIAF